MLRWCAARFERAIAEGTAAGARPFALPDGRCVWFDGVRLPRDIRAIARSDCERRTAACSSTCITTGRGFQIDERGGGERCAAADPLSRARVKSKQDAGRQRIVQRESGIGAQILIDLGLRRIRVLTNHPRKVVALEGYGLEIVDQVPLAIDSSKESHEVI